MNIKEKIKDTPVEKLFLNGKEIQVGKTPIFGDDRGYFSAINFDPDAKRAYLIKNHRAGIVRAFHGHKEETKILYAIRDGFKVICLSMESGDWKNFNITEKGNNLIKIPAMVFHGFVSLTDDSELLIVSNKTFEESTKDDFRMPYDVLGKKVWDINYR